MRAHYLQHVPFEGLGSIERWLRTNAFEVTHTRFFDSANLPDLDPIDLLVIMGGPMSVNDEDQYPWLAEEKRFVHQAIQAGKAVVGVCLGAQIIASAMGAAVYPNREKEIGWFPIQAVPAPDASVFSFPPSITVFHWHGETFDLPPGAIRLASSEACENQAFQLGNKVIGLQFHLETTPDSLEDIVSHCSDEILPLRYIQSAEEMRAADPDQYRAINDLMDNLLDYLHP